MSNVNTTTMADAIKTMYEKRLLTRALPRLVHGRWAMNARLNKFGSYELRKYGSLAAVTASLTEGTTPAEESAPTLTLTTITPAFYGSWMGHTDVLEMEEFDPIISEVSSILGEQCGLSADTIIRNALNADATIDYSANQAARTALDAPAHNVSYADFIKQVAYLEGSDAMPVDGSDFICIIHPYSWATLMQDPIFVNLFIDESESAPNGGALRTGYMGRVLRCKIYVSSNAQKYINGGVSGTDVYTMLFIAKESYGIVGIGNITPNLVDGGGDGYSSNTGKSVKPVEIIVKQLGSAGATDPLNQRATIGWKMALAVNVLNSAWIRTLEHTNAFSDD